LLISYSIKNNYKFAGQAFGISAVILGGIGSIYSKAFMSGFIELSNIKSLLIEYHWWIYIILLAIGNIGLAPVQQVGFQKGKAIVVSPLTMIGMLIISIIGGVVIFEEWNLLSFQIIFLKIIAIMILTVGIIILSFSKSILIL